MTSLKSAGQNGRALIGQRRLAARAAFLLAMCVPMQLALAQDVDQMITDCLRQQNVADRENAEMMEARRISDPYLNAHANAPVNTSGGGDNGFSCYETTKGAIDSLLQQTGLFGGALGALIGQLANNQAGGACGKARQAISGEFRKALLGAGVNGAVVNAGSQALGGAMNGYAPSQYMPGVVSAGTTAAANGAASYAPPVARSATGGAVRSLGSKMSCFIAGNCAQEQ